MLNEEKDKDNIQKELDELSWSFSIEKDEVETEDDDFIEDMEEEEPADIKTPENLQDIDVEDLYQNEELGSWYAGSGDYGLNDMGRNRGIVFDEDKLKRARVTEWHKPSKLKKSWLEKFAKGVAMIIFWPLRAIYFIVANFLRGLAGIVGETIKLVYKILKAIIIFPWQLLVAFKHVFVYLFGDFSWLKARGMERLPAAIDFEPKIVSLVAVDVWKRVGVFALVAVLLVLPLQVYVTLHKAEDIKGQVLGASQLGLTHLHQAGVAGADFNLSGAEEEFKLAEREFTAAQLSVNEMGALANKLGSFVPDLAAGQKLLKVARETAQIGQHLMRVASVWGGISAVIKDGSSGTFDEATTTAPILADISEDKNKINWQQAKIEMDQALEKAANVMATLEETDLEDTALASYQPKFEELKQKIPEITNWLSQARDTFAIMTYIMGIDEPKRWMLVFQNNAELRPTGGFMGSYAIVDMKDGKVTDIQVPGGGFYDLKGSLATAVNAPYPFHLFSPTWQLWNANWFPDFPASAEKIRWFYDKSGGSTVDGVIAFTPNVLEKILELTGEIAMPEYQTVVKAENFVRLAQIEVELEYDKEENQPKKFIGDLLPKVLKKLTEVDKQKILDVWHVVSDALKEKHLLVYFNNETIQKMASDFGWTGAMLNTPRDYLSVVQTNVAGGKTDRVIKTKIDHQVELMDDGAIIDTVTFSKEHNGKAEDVFEGHVNTDYVRFYVPQGSQLMSAEGFDVLPTDREFQIAAVEQDPHLEKYEKNLKVDESSGTRITEEFSKTVFANWMSVAPGESKSVKIKYLLPFKYTRVKMAALEDEDYNLWDLIKKYFLGKEKKAVKQESGEQVYSLLIQKQAGTDGVEFESKIKLAPNWAVQTRMPESVKVGDNVEFKSVLDTDKFYGVEIKSN